MYIVLLLLCVIVLVAVHVYFRYSRIGRLLSKIPCPKQYPLIGHLAIFFVSKEQLFKHLREYHKTFVNIYKFSAFHVNGVNIFKPEDIEVVLSSPRHVHKDLPYTFMNDWLGEGLLVSNGEKWKKRRKMLTPAFHFNILSRFFNKFCEQTQWLIDSIDNEVAKDKTDLISLINKFTLRTMCETSLSSKISDDSSLVNKYLKRIHEIGAVYARRLTTPIYFVSHVYNISPHKKIEKSYWTDLHNFTKQIIKKRRVVNQQNNGDETNTNKSRPAMLDLLLEEEKKGNIDENGIQEEVDTFLFEGYDTTATALIFMINRIANETDVQNAIFEELQGIYGDSDRTPTMKDLTRMKYLECCIKESLRLYPSVPFINRYIKEDIKLAGYTIPKNVNINIHIFDLHRAPDIYPDPEKFMPERFTLENSATRHPYAYIPFSAGPRNCIGQKYAMMNMKTFMSQLLRKYRLEPVTKTEDLVFVIDIILRVNHPIYVRFCHRKGLM